MRASGIHKGRLARPFDRSTRIGGLASALALAAGLSSAGGEFADDFRSACATPPPPGDHATRATPATLNAVLKAAHAGDVISLESGRYGQVRLSGQNTGFITIASRTGRSAVLASLSINGSHWLVRGVTIDGSTGAAQPKPTAPARWADHDWLVKIYGGDNIIVTNSDVRSQAGDFPWRAETKGVDDPTPLYSGVLAVNAGCVTISGNTISNVFNGLMVGGDQTGMNGKHYHVVENHIDNYAGDGIDHSTSDILISRNVITNSHDICEYQCVHADGIQGWTFNHIPGIVNTDVIIDGNVILQRTGPVLPQNGDGLQGVTIFDGRWKTVRVTNNVVATNSWHGITISGVDGLLVANNTVVATDGGRPTWISAGGETHQGDSSSNVTVRNNIATAIHPPKGMVRNMKADHNLIVDNPRGVFVEFNAREGRYDFHLRPGTSAIGHGSPDDAPPLDAERVARTGRIDLGAYQTSR